MGTAHSKLRLYLGLLSETEKIQLLTKAVDRHPPGHRHRDIHLIQLSYALSDRDARSPNDLDESIRLHREALQLRPTGHKNRHRSLNELCVLLHTRYLRTLSRDDLDETIDMYTEGLGIVPPGHKSRYHFLNNLASVLGCRYHLTGSRDDLDESVRILTEAVELSRPGHEKRGITLNNLASTLGDRYNLTGSRDDLDESIRVATMALKLHPPGNPRRGISLNHLGCALIHRYVCTGSQDDLDNSIRMLREALKLHPPKHSHRGITLDHLASALGHQYDRKSSRDVLDERIQLHTEALKLRPKGHLRHADALRRVVECLWHHTSRRDEVFLLLKETSSDTTSILDHCLRCIQYWIQWAREVHHDSLTDAYECAIQFLWRYLTIGPTVKLQYGALANRATMLSIPMDAAAHAIENGNVERAVEILDAGRSLLWSEMRRFREPLLHPSLVDSELATEFELIRGELQAISTAEARYDLISLSGKSGRDVEPVSSSTSVSFNVLWSRKRRLLERYEELLKLIREKPGCEDFLKTLPFNKLKEAAKEGPVILVNCSQYGSHIIIVFESRPPSVIPLDKDFHDQAFDMRSYYDNALYDTKNAQRESEALHGKLGPILCQLWDLVVSKVVCELEQAEVPKESRIWWCPTSALTVLPFHAAGDGDQYLIDSYISSYTPTLKALIDARQLPSPSTTQSSESLQHPKLLVIAPPDSNLSSAPEEVAVIRKLGSFIETLDDCNATQASVLERLRSRDWAHFICHGVLSKSGDPFDSSLHLYAGDTLNLNDIIKAHLPDAKFAFLAACHTAEQGHGGSALEDEVLHLAGAMQFSGFRSVVGTMWAMVDEDGPKIAKLFYAEMLSGNSDAGQRHTRAARALWEVTRKMKRSKTITLDRWVNFVHIGA